MHTWNDLKYTDYMYSILSIWPSDEKWSWRHTLQYASLNSVFQKIMTFSFPFRCITEYVSVGANTLMPQGRPKTWSAPSTQTLIDFFSTRQHYCTQLNVARSFRHNVFSEILKELSITDTNSRRLWLFREWKKNLAPVLLHNISASPFHSDTVESEN